MNTDYEFTVSLDGQEIRYFTRPGLPNWDSVSPSMTLLSEHVDLSHEKRVLQMGIGHGAAAVSLANKLATGKLWLMDNHWIALESAALTLDANQVRNASLHDGISLLPEETGTFEVVAIDLPKGRKLAQRWIIEAFHLLLPGGVLYLAGAKDWGIRTAIDDAEEIFGKSNLLAYKKGNRIASFRKTRDHLPGQGWWNAPGIAPGTWHEFQAETPQGMLPMRSLPGIFSFDRLDEGTGLLFPFLKVGDQDRMLDLGCGYGILGLAAILSGACQVDLVDENLLAVAATKENLRLHQVFQQQVHPSDVLSAVKERRYSLIATNPPFHSGKTVDYRTTQAFIEQSWQALDRGGRFLLVANRFIRYERPMEKIFRRVEILVQTSRFKVLQGEK